MTTIEARGTAFGFVDAKVKEGVAAVGVGNRDVEPLTLTLEPVGLELAAAAALDETAGESAEETAEETADAT